MHLLTRTALSPKAAIGALLSALVALGAVAATAAPGSLPGLSAETAAANCKGSDKGPRKISRSRASRATVCLVNKKRRARGLHRLRASGPLKKAAKRHSRRMQRKRCYAHQCPGEPALSGRFAATSYLPCNCRWGAAENIAWGRTHRGSPRRVVKAWMRSSGHRAVLLSRSLEHVGVGVRWGSPYKRRARAATYTLDAGFRD